MAVHKHAGFRAKSQGHKMAPYVIHKSLDSEKSATEVSFKDLTVMGKIFTNKNEK